MESGHELPSRASSVVKAIHVALPIVTSTVFILASCIGKLWPSERADRVEEETRRRLQFLLRRSTLFVVLGVVLTYVWISNPLYFLLAGQNAEIPPVSNRSLMPLPVC